MCIPQCPVTDGTGPSVLMWSLLKAHEFVHPPDIWPRDYGLVSPNVLQALTSESERAIARYESTVALVDRHVSRVRHGSHLVILLRNALQRLERIPSSFLHAVAIFAHIQRLVLELAGLSTYIGVVRPRLLDPTFRTSVTLDIRGGFLNEPAVAQEFYRVGVPFWLFQHYTKDIAISTVVSQARPISSSLSLEPAFPGIDQSLYDPSGACQDPSKWPAAMVLQASMQVAAASVPPLIAHVVSDPSGVGRLLKLTKTDDGATPSYPKPSQPKKKTHRGARQRGQRARPPHPAFTYLPPPCTYPTIPSAWQHALRNVKPLNVPPLNAATYFFPPPFLFEAMDAKAGRYAHNWLRIRTFARQRLVDVFIRGDPLRIEEWRDALYGDYCTPDTPCSTPAVNKKRTQAEQAAFERKMTLRRLFAGAGSLPSYQSSASPHWRTRTVSAAEANEDIPLRTAMVWELYEVNWRCELRALDRAMLATDLGDNAILLWERAELVSRVWASSGAFSIFPVYPDRPAEDLWPDGDWMARRSRVAALLDVMSRWPGFLQMMWAHIPGIDHCLDCDVFEGVERAALEFYVQVFTQHFGRLPTPPTQPPHT